MSSYALDLRCVPVGLSTFLNAPDLADCLPRGSTGFLSGEDPKNGSGKSSSSSEILIGKLDFELDEGPLDRGPGRDGPAPALEVLDVTFGLEDEDDDKADLSAEVVEIGCARDEEAKVAESCDRDDPPEGFFVWDATGSFERSNLGSFARAESFAAAPDDILRFFATLEEDTSKISLSSPEVPRVPERVRHACWSNRTEALQ
ncbi:hypothetical protein FRC00_012344 [Tulasnella sp. 408]|nr:hypothetical protein FRC00_012344 [Tulasnella sp. 408]